MLDDNDEDLDLRGIDEFAVNVLGVVRSGAPIRAREIAEVISPVHSRQLVTKVNSALYGQLAFYVAKDEEHRWSPRSLGAANRPTKTASSASNRTSHTRQAADVSSRVLAHFKDIGRLGGSVNIVTRLPEGHLVVHFKGSSGAESWMVIDPDGAIVKGDARQCYHDRVLAGEGASVSSEDFDAKDVQVKEPKLVDEEPSSRLDHHEPSEQHSIRRAVSKPPTVSCSPTSSTKASSQPRSEQVPGDGTEEERHQERRLSSFFIEPNKRDLKSCPQCALFKPLDEFGERRVAPNKVILQSWCRECRRSSKRRSAPQESLEASVPAGDDKVVEVGVEARGEVDAIPAGVVVDTLVPRKTLDLPTVAVDIEDGESRASVEDGEWAEVAIAKLGPREKDVAALSRAAQNRTIFGDTKSRFTSRKALEIAATAIQAARRERGLDTDAPWSLGELGATRYDLRWLRTWAGSLEVMDLEGLLKGTPEERATLGLLLLWLAIEEARRTKEVFQWRLVGKHFKDHSAWLLLCRNGELLTETLELIELAATYYHLRRPPKSVTNVNVHELLEFQYGFTAPAFGLDWLKGARPPVAVEVLLSPHTGSASFRAWWNALQEALLGDLPPEVAQERVDMNPWASAFSPGTLYAKLAAQRDKAPVRSPKRSTTSKANTNCISSEQSVYGLGGSKDQKINVSTVEAGCAPDFDGFLTPARVFWPSGGQPTFTTLLTNLDALELTRERYIVTVAGEPKAELVRRDNGSYQASPSDELEISLLAPRVAIQIVVPEGDIVTGCDLALWVPDDDIALYELHQGRRIDPWNDVLSCNHDYAMLLAPEFTLVSGPEGLIPSGADLPRVVHLKAGWSPKLSVTLEGEECWKPLLGSWKNLVPAWANQIALGAPEPPSILQFGDSIEPVVQLRGNLELSYARMAGRTLAVTPLGDNRYRLGPLEAHPEALNRGLLRVVLGMRRGNEFYRKNLSLGTVVLGGYLDTTQGPRTLRRDVVLDVDGAVALRFALLPKDNTTIYAGKRYSRWVLMEGERAVDRLTVNGRALVETLAGLGAPLTLRRDPFTNGTVKIEMARQVRQTGIVASVADGPEGWLHVRLRHPLEPDTRHRFILWMADGSQRNIVPSATAPDTWSIPGLAGLPGVVALAVTFGETRLGGAWPTAWHEALPAAFARSASEAAGLLRWFGCPILGDTARETVRSVLLTHLSACLALWLPPQGTSPTSTEAVWWSAVAELLGDTRLDELPLPTLLGDQQNEALVDIASPLLRLDPVLGARLVYAWTEMVGRTSTNMEVLERLRNSFGEQTDPSTSLRVCERALRLSRGLIIELVQRWEDVLAEDLRPPQRRLLRAGIQLVPEFRAYLGWHLLNHITQKLARKPLCRR